MKVHEIGKLLKEAGIKFWGDGAPRLSASLTFYMSLYLSPLLLTVVTVVGLVFGEQAARGQIVEQIHGLVGKEGAEVIQQLIVQSADTRHGIWSGIIAACVLIIGATGLFSTLQSALNTIWMVPGKPVKAGILTILRERLFTLVLVCGTAILLVISLVLSAILTGIDSRVAGWLPQSIFKAEFLNLAVTFTLLATLVAMIFKWLPETELPWSDVWLGSVITALLIVIGRYPIGIYLHRVPVGSAFGAAEALVVFLIWVYYTTQLLLFGAELTFLYATRFRHSSARDVPNNLPAAIAST
jgi:membrane protein